MFFFEWVAVLRPFLSSSAQNVTQNVTLSMAMTDGRKLFYDYDFTLCSWLTVIYQLKLKYKTI